MFVNVSKMAYMLVCLVTCLFSFSISYSLEIQNRKNFGFFWHVTDIHVDQNYSRTGNPHNLCHNDKHDYKDNGLYGNFLCDSPQDLVYLTFQNMRNIKSNPDFIIWTGDNLPHTDTFDPDWDVIYEALYNMTLLFEENFPAVPVFPCIGNHDTFPPNTLLPNESSHLIYQNILSKGGWDKYLTNESISSFLKGGFYSQVIKPGLRIISLNTILWYTPNNLTEKMGDPLNQFQWLEGVLRSSLKTSEKVYIIGHVPPGFYNRVKPGEKSSPTFHSQFLDTYLQILKKFSIIIKAQMFGHLHIDMFQLFQLDTGHFLSSSILASSVTPWHFESKYNLSIPVNPSIRLLQYDYRDGLLKDYQQFFFNLTKANRKIVTNESSTYELLYTFTEAYDVPDVSTESLITVFEKIKNSDIFFDKFFTFSTAGKKSVVCDMFCKVAQLCSISSTSIDEYSICMEKRNNDKKGNFNHFKHDRKYLIHPKYDNYFTIGISIFVVCILAVPLIFLYRKCKHNDFYSKL